MTSTTSTTWGGWQIVSPRCYKCLHSVITSGKVVCYCTSRIIRNGLHGDICESYLGCPATKDFSLRNDYNAKVVEE